LGEVYSKIHKPKEALESFRAALQRGLQGTEAEQLKDRMEQIEKEIP
jgi:hypothetical protein